MLHTKTGRRFSTACRIVGSFPEALQLAQSHGLLRPNFFLGFFNLSAQIPGTQPAGLSLRSCHHLHQAFLSKKLVFLFLLFQFLKAVIRRCRRSGKTFAGFRNTGLHFDGSFRLDLCYGIAGSRKQHRPVASLFSASFLKQESSRL